MFQLISRAIFVLILLSGAASANELMNPDGIPDKFIGNADAKATLIVYSSPTCSHCIHFEDEMLPELKKRYIDDGQLRVAIRPIVLNHIDTIIYLVSLANGPENRDKILEKFRSHYPEMVGSKDLETILRNIAAAEGINEQQFNQALNNKDYIQALEKLNKQATQKLDVKGTPTLFLNGTRIAYDGRLDSLSKEIDNAVNKKP